jgi:hypothetical protein
MTQGIKHTSNNLTGEKTAEQKQQEANIIEEIDNKLTSGHYNQDKINDIKASLPYQPHDKEFVEGKAQFLPKNTEFSPQNKNIADHLVEELFNKILHDPTSVTFKVETTAKKKQKIFVTSRNPIQYLSPLQFKHTELLTEQNEYGKKGVDMQVNVIEIDVKDMDVSELFARADLRNLTLDKALMDKYASLQANKKPPEWFNKAIEEEIAKVNVIINDSNNEDEKALLDNTLKSLEELKNLSYGEKLALRKYTSNNYYSNMNNILRGLPLSFERYMPPAVQVKNAFLDSVTIQNIIVNLKHPINYPTLRVEGLSRMQALKEHAQNNSITEDKSSISSSDLLLKRFAGAGGEIDFIIKNPQGIYIQPISHFPQEREILIGQSQLKFSALFYAEDQNNFKRLLLEADRVNVETDERKEKAKISGFNIKKHEYSLHVEPKEHQIEKVEFKETTVIKKGSLLQDDGASKATKHDIIKEQPANNADLVKKIASDPALKTEIEQVLTRSNKILSKAIKIDTPRTVHHKAQGLLSGIIARDGY